MDRTLLARRVAPVAVFAAVLGTVVLVSRHSNGSGGDPRPIPVAAGGTVNTKSGEARDASAPMMATFGTVTIPDRLLAGLPTEGPTHTLGRDGSDRTAALAKALGVAGAVRNEPDGWSAGTDPRVLHVANVPGLPWYLSTDAKERYAYGVSGVGVATAVDATATPDEVDGKDPESKPGTVVAEPCPSPTADGAEICMPPVPASPPPPPNPAPQPSDAEARAAADPVLAAAGVTGATVTTRADFLGKEVVASPVVGGLPTSGYETRLTIDADGAVVMGGGYLAHPSFDDTYPLLDPRAALERGVKPYDGREPMTLEAPCEAGKPCPTYAEPPAREATAVRLGLLLMPSFDEGNDAFLVPAWLLSFEGSDFEEPVLALPDRYLATPPPPTGDPDEPVCSPEPCGKPVPPDSGVSNGGGLTPGTADPGTPEPDFATDQPLKQ
jgi:hypothetical protein